MRSIKGRAGSGNRYGLGLRKIRIPVVEEGERKLKVSARAGEI